MPRDAFHRAAQRYLGVVAQTRSAATHKDYTETLGKLHKIVLNMGLTNIRKWTPMDVVAILQRRGQLLPSSIRVEMTVLRRMLLYAGVTAMERAYQQGLIKLPRASRVNVRWHSEQTVAAIRAACRTDQEYMMVVLAGTLGLRRKEIAELKVSDIRGDLLVVGGRTNEPMTVPLVSVVAVDVERWLSVRRQLVSKHPGEPIPEELLIYSYRKRLRSFTPELVTERMEAIGKRLGIKLSPHDLRRTCGRELYRHTRDILAVQRLLRHRSVEMTRLYIGTDLEDARTALETWLASKARTT